MAKQNKSDTPAALAVTPPPVSRGGRKSLVKPATVAAMVEIIENGGWATAPDSDGNIPPEFVAASDSDKDHKSARQRANTVATRHKKAILNSPDNEYSDPKSLMTRVWEDSEGVYTFVVGERPASDGDGE